MLFDNFIISDDIFLQPIYRISPFKNEHILNNSNFSIINSADSYLSNKFDNKNYIYTKSGRDAINTALCELSLSHDDVVTVLTTSNNKYISGCVTNEIEKYCKWSREIQKDTKVIFVNHEFGFPYEKLIDLQKYNLPIIEDCAHSFFSQNKENSVGLVGDYVIYSLPKFFPIQFGGILKLNINRDIKQDISEKEESYIKKVLSGHINNLDAIKSKRRSNYKYLEQKLAEVGFKSRFNLEYYHCPGVYIFKSEDMDLKDLKIFLQTHGVECSVFYGEESFFIPVNQSLDEHDLDYFCALIKYFKFVREES